MGTPAGNGGAEVDADAFLDGLVRAQRLRADVPLTGRPATSASL
jgi:hypothetical protein